MSAAEKKPKDGYEEYSQAYEHAKLPAEVTRTLYVTYGIGKHNAGRISLEQWDHKATGVGGFDSIPLCTFRVKVPLPRKIDLKGKLITVLEEEKKSLQAEYTTRMNDVQSRINHLLAIEYQPEEGGAQ